MFAFQNNVAVPFHVIFGAQGSDCAHSFWFQTAPCVMILNNIFIFQIIQIVNIIFFLNDCSNHWIYEVGYRCKITKMAPFCCSASSFSHLEVRNYPKGWIPGMKVPILCSNPRHGLPVKAWRENKPSHRQAEELS